MAECKTCGDDSTPIPQAWGVETCGGCLAARLELLFLMKGDPWQRRPMRRATHDLDIEIHAIQSRA